MLRKYPYIIIAIILLISIYMVIFSNQQPSPVANHNNPITESSPTPSDVDYTASFLIFTNGTRRIFTDARYHNQSSDVFLQSTNPSIIQVKKPNITWKDFFSTLPMGLSDSCLTTGTGQTFCDGEDGSLIFWLNGKEEADVLNKTIQKNDKLLVTFGKLSADQIGSQFIQVPNPASSSAR